jgi:hypothetical protein
MIGGWLRYVDGFDLVYAGVLMVILGILILIAWRT